LILDELARLKRFRRIAQNHGIAQPEETMLPYQEVNYFRGLLNAKIYLESEDWMCPSWVALSLKDRIGPILVVLDQNDMELQTLVDLLHLDLITGPLTSGSLTMMNSSFQH